MREKQVDEIAQSALLLFPFLKHLFNGDPRDPALAPLRNHTYNILRILEREGPLPMLAIARRLLSAKQNMTTIIDKLKKNGLVERKYDDKDRRVIKIIITQKGIEFLKESRPGLKKVVKENLSKLSDEDIKLLHKVFRVIRNIVPKLHDEGR